MNVQHPLISLTDAHTHTHKHTHKHTHRSYGRSIGEAVKEAELHDVAEVGVGHEVAAHAAHEEDCPHCTLEAHQVGALSVGGLAGCWLPRMLEPCETCRLGRTEGLREER